MPTSKELVSNKPLGGLELARIILADVTRMLTENGLLAGQTAYSRVSYDLRLTLHLDLPNLPLSEDHARSRTQAHDQVEQNPALAALEPSLPLPSPSPNAILSSTGLSREITSPNLARVEHSLPIEVTVMGGDGHSQEQLVTYHPSDVGMADADFREPDFSDLSEEAKKELGL